MIRIGMLTPSSNTVLEPVSQALLAAMPGVSLHYARFRVTEIALGAAALGQFDLSPMLEAAELLSHAKVHGIAWNSTSASWLGLAQDRALCAAIEERTGLPATTCVLSMVDRLRGNGWSRIALVTPYTDDVQAQIIANLRSEGFDTVAERHLGLRDNFSFALVDRPTLDGMVAEVSEAAPDAIIILCTNLAGALFVPGWEERHGIPVLDSVSLTLDGALRARGVDTAPLNPFGRLFSAA
jgi:maleate isomerase